VTEQFKRRYFPAATEAQGRTGQPSPAHLVEAQEEAHPPCLLAVAAVRPSAY